MATRYANIFQYIQSKEKEFDRDIDVNGWTWNFKDHRKTTFFYKHGRLLNGNDPDTPVRNITKRLLTFQYSAENVGVQDVTLYVDDPDNYFLSFLVKKYYYDVFVPENDLDTFFDELNETKVDYGVGIAQKGADARPISVDLHSIVFADQTNFEKGAIGFKHNFNPAELLEMAEHGWGEERNGATISLKELIAFSDNKKDSTESDSVENTTTSNYVEVYEVHGVLPKSYLNEDAPDNEFERQMHIVAFYEDKDDNKHGVTLFKKREPVNPFKVIKRDEIPNRCAGWGGGEELFEAQVWTNNDVIRMQDQLTSASKIVLKGVGAEFKTRFPSGLRDVDNLDIVDLGEGEDLQQIDLQPRSLPLFVQSMQMWEEHARQVAFATEPLLGEQAPSGTPFSSQERQVVQGKQPHEYRIDKFARLIEEIHREWIIPHIQKKIVEGAKFLTTLSADEMKYVADAVVRKKSKDLIADRIFSGELVTKEDEELIKTQVREQFLSGGNKRFIEILKGEFKNKKISVKVDVKGRQKDLGRVTAGLTNIFRQIIANPMGFKQAMQEVPELAQAFNGILEYSNFSPIQYAGLTKSEGGQMPTQQPQAQNSGATPQLEALQTNQQQ